MGLETGTYVADLNIANPTATDQKSQGDDHLRLIKTALRNSFPGFTGAVIATGTNGGVVNAYTLTPTTALVAYVTPMLIVFVPNATNTLAATINVSALGAKSLKSVSGAALAAGELVSGAVYVAAYDGTNFNLVAPTKGYIDALAFSAVLPLQTGNAGKFVKTDGTTAAWAALATSDIAGFSATAAQTRTGTSTAAALTPGDTYNALAEVALTSATNSIAVDMATFINAIHTLTENTTLANPSNTKVGQCGYIRIVQHASAAKTLAVGSNWKRAGGALAVSTTLSGTDILVYQVITSTLILYDLLRNPS